MQPCAPGGVHAGPKPGEMQRGGREKGDMEIREYLELALGLIRRIGALERRGMEDGVQHANLERELRELNERFDAS